uniref:Photosystem II subunit Z n=1 Tax=Karenia brevis TaxID=156230 RepID=A0A0S2QDA3_KARBR|nr:photosystem II subunit Z [Karenia brevis]
MPALAKDDDDDDSGVKAPPLRTDAVLQARDKYEFGRKYKADTKLMIDNMKIVTDMGRGTPQMEDIAKATRKQMIEYISLYRARPETTKLPSFSVMYTAINTVAGHYASYGYKYPIPEKRRVRLAEQYLEVERALARGK